MGKRSKLLKLAIIADVTAWANYGFYKGDHTNPFSDTDKRHAMFAKILGRQLAVDADFREMHVLHGGDLSQLTLRPYSKPAMRTIDEISATLVVPA